jgi:hypothetical protein
MTDKQKLEWCGTPVGTLENLDCVGRQEESNKKNKLNFNDS